MTRTHWLRSGLLLVAMATVTACQPAVEWKTYRDPMGAFSVEFPGTPACGTDRWFLHGHACSFRLDRLLYRVTTMPRQEAERVARRNRVRVEDVPSSLVGRRGTLEGKREVTVGGTSGVHYDVLLPQGYAYYRTVETETDLYWISVEGSELGKEDLRKHDFDKKTALKRFFRSLKLRE